MGALTELAEYLAKLAGDSAGRKIDAVGAQFLSGAARPGTFERGREFAKTPEGLAAQFDWGAPHDFQLGADAPRPAIRSYNPDDPGAAAWAFPIPYADMRKSAQSGGTSGWDPHFRYAASDLPEDGAYYAIDTGALGAGTGQGKRAYGALYGTIANDPNKFNVKDVLTGANVYRNNYNLASAIMRQPEAGGRFLMSPEQFTRLPADVTALRRAGPERQVGSLQTEGALQTLQRLERLATAQRGSPVGKALDALPAGLSSSASPYDISQWAAAVRAARAAYPGGGSTAGLGEGALRRLGIVSDSLQGRPVDPAAFRRLEFKAGGLALVSQRR